MRRQKPPQRRARAPWRPHPQLPAPVRVRRDRGGRGHHGQLRGARGGVPRRARALLLERFDLLHHLGSSHGESRAIRDAYPKAHYPPMVRLARRLWADAEAESGYRVLTPAPQLTMGPPGNAALLAAVRNGGAEEVDLARRWGGALRVLDGWVAAVSEHGGGVLNATKAVAMFQALAVKKGAVVKDNAEVVGITKGRDGGVVVKTSGGEEFHGAKCLPIQPLHTMVLYWRIKPGRERELTAEAGFPTFSSYGDPHVYSTPSLELPGLIKINYDGGPPCDPDSRDWASGGADVAERVAGWIEEFMPGHVETAGGPVLRQPCMYSMTPDKDFVIDFLGGEFGEDVVVGAGFSGHGFKMGPAVGRILAEMAIEGEAKTAARPAWSWVTQDQPVRRQPHGKCQRSLSWIMCPTRSHGQLLIF
ncbi:hypothetical protein ACP70R_033679 [Stipagrostis hirtigluma subsp. patula]